MNNEFFFFVTGIGVGLFLGFLLGYGAAYRAAARQMRADRERP